MWACTKCSALLRCQSASAQTPNRAGTDRCLRMPEFVAIQYHNVLGHWPFLRCTEVRVTARALGSHKLHLRARELTELFDTAGSGTAAAQRRHQARRLHVKGCWSAAGGMSTSSSGKGLLLSHVTPLQSSYSSLNVVRICARAFLGRTDTHACDAQAASLLLHCGLPPSVARC